MNVSRIAVLPAVLLVASMAGNAATRIETIRIKILDSETRSTSLDDSGVPRNCDMSNYDAYCNSSKTAQVTNTLLAQEDDLPPFRIACTVDSKLSRCQPLSAGESYDARREKHGLIVYYEDEKGKPHKQFYALLDSGAVIQVSTAQASSRPAAAKPAAQTQPAILTHAEDALRAAVSPKGTLADAAKCTFVSTPDGAEITLDGHYAGSTPSLLDLSPGVHSVTISLPGYAHWNRELTVSSGSELTVKALLEKAQ